MCGVIGLSGNFDKKLLFSMIESLSHRGMDSTGYFLYNKESDKYLFDNDSKLKIDSDENTYTIGLGHNLLSIFNIIDENSDIEDNVKENGQSKFDNLDENRQPIILNNLAFIFNGEIYNFNKLENHLKTNNANYKQFKSDSQLLANLIKYHYDNIKKDNEINDNYLLESVKAIIKHLDGDYSFAIYDMDYDDLVVSRDSIGVKPLFYGINNELKGFASERKSLWKIGFKDHEIKDLKPGTILCNWEEIDLEDDLINKIINKDFKELKSSYDTYKDYLDTKDSYDVYKELLRDDIYSAVEKRVSNLSEIGLIFSGGVDSSILAVILKEIAQKRENDENSIPLKIRLYSVGLENSQDIKFSKEIAKELDLELKTIIIDEDNIRDSVEDVLIAIEDDNLMKLGVGMTIYLASKAIHDDGIKVALSGQGADELFGGYNRYLKHFDGNSLFDAYFDLDEGIYHDIANMYHVNLERDDAVSMANGVELRVPFLDKEVIYLALDIPGKFKIRNGDDLLRKHILRDVAKDIGVAEHIAERPKKAAQYGSGINKILKRKVLKTIDIGDILETYKKKEL